MPIYKPRIVLSCMIVAALCCGATPAHADAVSFLQRVDAGRVKGIGITDNKVVAEFYHQHGGAPLWMDGKKFTYEANRIIDDMEQSWTQGLNPANYHVDMLRHAVEGEEAELLMTDSVLRYAHDLAGMRLPPKLIDEDPTSWARNLDNQKLLEALAKDRDPAALLRYLAPQDKTYVLLVQALQDLVKDIKDHPEEPFAPVTFPGTLKPGMSAKAITAIRNHLNKPAAKPSEDTFYDDKLKKAVEQFQKENGLKPDGLIGRRSFAAINQTRNQKLIKILANLERRRWVRRPVPERYVAVNIPAMVLRAVDKNEIVFETPVIVGAPKTPTMSFGDEIIGIRFNPSWYVPDTIKNKEYLPKLQKDPNALEKNGIKFHVRTSEGVKEVSGADIDWQNMTSDELKTIQMLQDPGEKNVLGRIRVLMPNRYDIYLHDTSAPELFAKDDRALSHGCVRLSEPVKIANFVLGKNPTWSEARLNKYLGQDKTVEVAADATIPVYLFYYTAWLDMDQQLILGDDLYGLDSKLVYYLQQAGKLPFAVKVNAPAPQKP